MKPSEVNEENKTIVWNRLFGHIVTFDKPKYSVGDKVRVLDFAPRYAGIGRAYRERHEEIRSKTPKARKQYTEDMSLGRKDKPPFSNEVFTITSVLIQDPIIYKLFSEEYDTEILGGFYESELSLVK